MVFITLIYANAEDHLRIAIALVLSLIFGFIAFFLNWLTLDGMKAGVLFGTISYGLGGITGAVTVLAFFISSSLLSKDLISEEALLDKKFRRNGNQVWSNGFWFAIWMIVWFLTDMVMFEVIAIASIAFATADTWASEIGGHRVKGTTWSLIGFRKVPPGTDGGVSLVGTLSSVAGAVFIGGLFWIIDPRATLWSFLVIVISGFTGSVVDSLLGASVQGKAWPDRISGFFNTHISYVDNNTVNWLAAGAASVVAVILLLLTGDQA